MACLNAGDHCIVSDVAYGGTYRLCTQVLNRFGVEFTFADTSDPAEVRKRPARQHAADPHRDARPTRR